MQYFEDVVGLTRNDKSKVVIYISIFLENWVYESRLWCWRSDEVDSIKT